MSWPRPMIFTTGSVSGGGCFSRAREIVSLTADFLSTHRGAGGYGKAGCEYDWSGAPGVWGGDASRTALEGWRGDGRQAALG